MYSLMGGLFILRIINDPFTMRFLNVYTYIHNNILCIDNHWFHLPPRHRSTRRYISKHCACDFPFHNIMHRLQLQQKLKTIIICNYWSIKSCRNTFKKVKHMFEILLVFELFYSEIILELFLYMNQSFLSSYSLV